MRKSALGVWIVLVMMSGPAFAAEEIGIDVTADLYGKYIWRGQNLNDDHAFQPGISMTIDKFTAGIWGSLDTTDYNGESGEFIEYDYYLDYTTSIAEGVDMSAGVIYYYFPGVEDTTEVYAGLAFDAPLSPSVTLYYDMDEVESTYISFGVGHSVEKIGELSQDMPIGMEIGASVGWASESYNEFYWGAPADDGGAFNDLAVSVAFPIAIGDWTVAPSVNYVTLLDSDIRKTDAYDTASDYLFTGISLSTSF